MWLVTRMLVPGLIDIEAIAHGGGGIHCVTNEQPVLLRNPEE
jgi:hypothetical protein